MNLFFWLLLSCVRTECDTTDAPCLVFYRVHRRTVPHKECCLECRIDLLQTLQLLINMDMLLTQHRLPMVGQRGARLT